jgi:hypothetical protein
MEGGGLSNEIIWHIEVSSHLTIGDFELVLESKEYHKLKEPNKQIQPIVNQ